MTSPRFRLPSLLAMFVAALTLAGAGCFGSTAGKPGAAEAPAAETPPPIGEVTYRIAGEDVTLRGGRGEIQVAPVGESKSVYSLVGDPISGDFDGDGDKDAASFLVWNGGGSGYFFNVVVAASEPEGYRGLEAVLLGDRVAPQTLRFLDGLIVADYLTRRADRPMTDEPTLPETVRLRLVDGRLEAAE